MGIRVLIVTGSALELEEVLRAIQQVPELDVVGAIQDPANLATAVREMSPDVVLFRMTEFSPAVLDILSQLRDPDRPRGVVALTEVGDNARIIAMLKAGVNAILPMAASSDDLRVAVREAVSNRLYVPPRRRNGD